MSGDVRPLLQFHAGVLSELMDIMDFHLGLQSSPVRRWQLYSCCKARSWRRTRATSETATSLTDGPPLCGAILLGKGGMAAAWRSSWSISNGWLTRSSLPVSLTVWTIAFCFVIALPTSYVLGTSCVHWFGIGIFEPGSRHTNITVLQDGGTVGGGRPAGPGHPSSTHPGRNRCGIYLAVGTDMHGFRWLYVEDLVDDGTALGFLQHGQDEHWTRHDHGPSAGGPVVRSMIAMSGLPYKKFEESLTTDWLRGGWALSPGVGDPEAPHTFWGSRPRG